jgi:hypothetical protein
MHYESDGTISYEEEGTGKSDRNKRRQKTKYSDSSNIDDKDEDFESGNDL